jgi:hypothetical protein
VSTLITRCVFPSLVAGSLLALGCVAGAPDDEETSASAVGAGADALVWTNGDVPSTFWQPAVQAALQALAQAPLTDGNGNLPSSTVMATTGGQAVLHYVVGCALPAGTSAVSPDTGAAFAGAMGLAPEWAQGPLSSASSQRWVTACLLQTLNALGAHVPLSLAGNSQALSAQPQAAAAYTVPDATAFGNLFLPGGGPAYACTDISLISSCGLQVSLNTVERICGLTPTCGLTLLGPCDWWCAGGAGGASCVDPAGNAYPQAISTSLVATVAVPLTTVCQL